MTASTRAGAEEAKSAAGSGTLYVVATPIGNLGDITYRAVEVLRACPVIAAEDTRRLRILAERYGFHPRRVIRSDEHTEEVAAVRVVETLAGGEDVALTSDAGTPGVSDPGFRLVRGAREAGLRVVPVPGPCSPVAALSVSGLPTERFLFAGFPPRRSGRLRQFLGPLLARPETLLLLESPERVLALLQAVAEIAPDRRLVVARELTKLHEELVTGAAEEVAKQLVSSGPRVRGEIVVVIEGARPVREADQEPPRRGRAAAGEDLARQVLRRSWIAKLSRRDVADLLATACGLDRNFAYRIAQQRGEP